MKAQQTRFILLLSATTLSVTAAIGCAASQSQFPQTQPAPKNLTQVDDKSRTANYKGVSFTVDPSLTSEIQSQTLAAVTDSKPCDIVPEHPAFTLVGYPRPRAMPENNPHIRVFSIAKFREAMHQAGVEMAKSTNPPHEDWGPWVDEEVRVLRALLAKKPDQKNLNSFIRSARDPRVSFMHDNYPQMPFLPMWEATQAFVSHLKYISFKNGKGIFFLTQWNTADTSQVTNDGLEYAFQGITDDEQYYVYAEFSVASPGLPHDSDQEVRAWNEKNYLLPHRSEKYQTYLRPVLAKLEALPANQFQPNLELLEQLIQSLEVQIK